MDAFHHQSGIFSNYLCWSLYDHEVVVAFCRAGRCSGQCLKKLGNFKGTKQNTCNRNTQDSKVINPTKIKLNKKETNIVAAGYKYNYPERSIQTIKQNMAIETEIAINRLKMNNNTKQKKELTK